MAKFNRNRNASARTFSINREAVARSLRELEILFGKKPLSKKDNALREQGVDATGITQTRDVR